MTDCARAFDLERLGRRYEAHLAIRYGSPRPGTLVRAVLQAGDLERGRTASILNTTERTARTVLAACLGHGFLKAETPKGRVRVGFPVSERAWLFPGLFADEPEPLRPPPLKINEGRGGVGR